MTYTLDSPIDAAARLLPTRRENVGVKTLHVVVLTPLGLGGKGGIDRLMDELNEVIRSRPGLAVDVAFYKTRGDGPLWSSIGLMLWATGALIGRKLTGRVDLVHINLAHSGSVYRKIALGLVCRLLHIPYIVHLHGSRFRQTWSAAPPWLSHQLERFFAGSASTLVLGKVWQQYVGTKAPAVADRILLFPTAARNHALHEVTAKPIVDILFSGKHGPRKGTPQLVAALGLLPAEPAWRAHLTGNGEIDTTRQAVKALGLDDRISVPGWITTEEHQQLLEAADVLVLPSFDENLPLSIVEAFARGIAVVSTPVGAIADIVEDDFSGLLVEPGDVDGLAAALTRLIADPSLRARLGREGRRIFEDRLEIEGYTDRLLAVWHKAAKAA